MPCFHLVESGEPDLLGEAFEWLAERAACSGLDQLGRVPPEHTLSGTYGLDRTIPWANRWLARVHAKIRDVLPGLPADPPLPFGPGRTFVASHDLDHLSVDSLVNARRLVKNIGIALVRRHDARTAAQIVRAAAGQGSSTQAHHHWAGRGPVRGGGTRDPHVVRRRRRVDPPPRPRLHARPGCRASGPGRDRRRRARDLRTRQLRQPQQAGPTRPRIPAARRRRIPGGRRAPALASVPRR